MASLYFRACNQSTDNIHLLPSLRRKDPSSHETCWKSLHVYNKKWLGHRLSTHL